MERGSRLLVGRVLSWNNVLLKCDFSVLRKKQRLGVRLCCDPAQFAWAAAFLAQEQQHHIPRSSAWAQLTRGTVWATPGMWHKEEGMLIVDADLSVFMCLLLGFWGFFWWLFSFCLIQEHVIKKCWNVEKKRSFNEFFQAGILSLNFSIKLARAWFCESLWPAHLCSSGTELWSLGCLSLPEFSSVGAVLKFPY